MLSLCQCEKRIDVYDSVEKFFNDYVDNCGLEGAIRVATQQLYDLKNERMDGLSPEEHKRLHRELSQQIKDAEQKEITV